MKKIVFFIIGLISIITAYADPITIVNNNLLSRMIVTYEVCPLQFKNPSRPYCDPIQHIILDPQHTKKTIEVDNFAFYIKVKHAIAQDQNNNIIALGDFPGKEECKGFTNSTIFLDDRGTAGISCQRLNR